jgi:hypothetical protein
MARIGDSRRRLMDEERCECCDVPLYSCGKAAQAAQAAELRAQIQRALQEPGVYAAKILIRACPGCKSAVPVGHPIRKTRDGWVGVLCCDGTDT